MTLVQVDRMLRPITRAIHEPRRTPGPQCLMVALLALVVGAQACAAPADLLTVTPTVGAPTALPSPAALATVTVASAPLVTPPLVTPPLTTPQAVAATPTAGPPTAAPTLVPLPSPTPRATVAATPLICPVHPETCAFALQLGDWLANRDYAAVTRASLPQAHICASGGSSMIAVCQGSQPGERRVGYQIFGYGSEGTLITAADYQDGLRRFVESAVPSRADDLDSGEVRVHTVGCPGTDSGPTACRDVFLVVVSAIVASPHMPAPAREPLAFNVRRQDGATTIRALGYGIGLLAEWAPVAGGPVTSALWAVTPEQSGPGHFYPIGRPRRPRPTPPTLVLATAREVPQPGVAPREISLIATDGRYVLWSSVRRGGPNPDMTDLYATRLSDGWTVLIARPTAEWGMIAFDGGLLVREQRTTTGGDILATDVTTGVDVAVAATDADETSPVLAYPWVAWISRAQSGGPAATIMLRDLRAMTPAVPVATSADGVTSIALGRNFIAWATLPPGSPYEARPYELRRLIIGETTSVTVASGRANSAPSFGAAGDFVYTPVGSDSFQRYDVRTGAARTFSAPASTTGRSLASAIVSDRYLVWRAYATTSQPMEYQIEDLVAGTTHDVALEWVHSSSDLLLAGDTVVWLEFNPISLSTAIHAAPVASLAARAGRAGATPAP